ncbi:acyl-CoA dehydrogenase family protein [Nonomuraea rhizosphaerae]|uniref:acyl-CoA dehydrogenase family protein n=1 Tax=Nonomuraea rhizosphaerae TaxID=2665663 RepID=UPI001C5F3117|nr:acyl-CoA dehydrogenase family protein [Nonomuraea rhizosphaerae]
MTTDLVNKAGTRHPVPTRAGDERFVPMAARIGAVAAEHAAEHDRDATFVRPAYEAMRTEGYLRLAVPAELGGLGATVRQVCHAQAELARHDGATALAIAMHQFNTLTLAYLRRHGAPGAEDTLRRVAGAGLVIATSGGSDWLWPETVAVPDGDGFRVSGRKVFCSQAPGASVVTTCAVVGEPGEGAEVIHFTVPLAAEGVRIEETWDTLGMRGTASHDLVLENVLVSGDSVEARRPWGEFGAPLMTAGAHFAPVVSAVYFGIAAAARDVAVAQAAGGSRGPSAMAGLSRVHRQIGLMDARLRVAWWALMGSLDELGDEYACDPPAVVTMMLAKREAVEAAVEVVNLAMDLAGGRSYFRRFPLERAYRDVRAGAFHPFTPEATLSYAGRVTLGDPGVSE